MSRPNSCAQGWLLAGLIAANLQISAASAAPANPHAPDTPGATPPAPAAAPLGRLFLTPERRLALDRQRLLNIPDEKKVDAPQLRLDGVVIRSTGKRTAWVNGRAISERDTHALRVTTHPGRAGEAVIGLPTEPGHAVPVGGSVNRETGEVQTPLGSGRVTVGSN